MSSVLTIHEKSFTSSFTIKVRQQLIKPSVVHFLLTSLWCNQIYGWGMSFTSAQLHIDIDSTIHSIPEETRSFLLKVVHGIVLFALVYNSHFICLQARTRQKPLKMWATPMRPEPCFPECMLVISNKTLLVITPPFTTTLSYHRLPLSPSRHQVKIRSCRCSRKPNVWCCRTRLKVCLSFKPLTPSALST